jgi:catechol 2,3-dioxygenase-like lactoylglutathione lyase family enzyme
MDRERSENVTNNGQPEPAGCEQAANPLQPAGSSRHATTPNAKVEGIVAVPPLDRRPPCLFPRQRPQVGTFEVFGPRDQDHEYFSTGPVVGFVVDDLTAAVRELEAAGVELLGGQVDERGGGWRHFRAPDGNVYELTSG